MSELTCNGVLAYTKILFRFGVILKKRLARHNLDATNRFLYATSI